MPTAAFIRRSASSKVTRIVISRFMSCLRSNMGICDGAVGVQILNSESSRLHGGFQIIHMHVPRLPSLLQVHDTSCASGYINLDMNW